MRSSRSSLLAASAIALMGASALHGVAVPTQSTTDGARSTRTSVASEGTVGTNSDTRRGGASEKAAWARHPSTTRGWKHLANDGWSVRQGQRMAKKRRNQQRHRAACRRA